MNYVSGRVFALPLMLVPTIGNRFMRTCSEVLKAGSKTLTPNYDRLGVGVLGLGFRV